MTTNVDVVLDSIDAVERRDVMKLLDLMHDDIEFYWPPSLPYGRRNGRRGQGKQAQIAQDPATRWDGIWDPLQPTVAERKMDPRVVASSDDEVVVLWHQRAEDSTGERLDEPVLGLYQVKDGKLRRAQMFYFDSVTVANYLGRAKPTGHGAFTEEVK